MFTQADLAAVQAAIAKGERHVQYADRAVTYRSLDELLQAEARISHALVSGASSTRSKQTVLVAGKGLC